MAESHLAGTGRAKEAAEDVGEVGTGAEGWLDGRDGMSGRRVGFGVYPSLPQATIADPGEATRVGFD